MTLERISRSGEYFRLADPEWPDPLEGRYSMDLGGRWNKAGSFPVVYLNRTKAVARLNLVRKLEGQPYAPEDLRPGFAPVLVTTEIPARDYVDVVTDIGCVTAGLPSTYPVDNRAEVPRAVCQPIGRLAWDSGEAGIACRSATTHIAPYGEELALFQRRDLMLEVLGTEEFDRWFFLA